MTLVIMPEGGLCNMLRVVFSWYAKAKKEGRELVVCWALSDACPGFFLDYFEPVPGIRFIKGYNPGAKYDYQGCGVLEEFNYLSMYAALKPKAYIQARVDANIAELKSGGLGFVAIHARRTDHVMDAMANNKFTSDATFFQFLNNQSQETNIYLATDNLGTQETYKARYGNRIKAMKWITPRRALRQTGLEDAVVDIYTCVGANVFLGSGWSSFTDLINDLRMMC
jgi:hypothetical protein